MRDILKVVQTILAGLDHPRALTVKILIDHGEWGQLVNLTAEAAQYADAMSYRMAAQATDLLRKADFLPTAIDLHQEAVKKFVVAEQQCYRTNDRLYGFVFQAPRLNGPAPERILSLARKNIASWLGKFSDLRVAELAGHGPGATYDDRGQLVTVADKMSSNPTLTPDAWPWLIPWSGTHWATACASNYQVRSPKSVPGNRFTSVPKDAKTNRGIAIEPSLNVYYQLGIGRLLKERLRRNAGVDLRRAQSVHRAAARTGSITGDLATIDLSNASDTVCKNLVKILLPKDWYDAMASVRSPKTLVEGRWILLEKFSSMGNGFTFELESLIFLALAAATSEFLDFESHRLTPTRPSGVVGTDILVYGDDIIVPTRISREVITVLEFCGFTPNPRKTFVCGSFRESCGGDYFDGEAVRPMFIKEAPKEPIDWVVLANRIRKSFGECLAWKRCLDNLPVAWRRVTGPERLGDVCVHTSSGFWQTTKHGITWNRAWIPINQPVGWEHFHPAVVLATALLGAGDGREGVTPRNPVIGHRLGWVSAS